jgi:hypothetical protein
MLAMRLFQECERLFPVGQAPHTVQPIASVRHTSCRASFHLADLPFHVRFCLDLFEGTPSRAGLKQRSRRPPGRRYLCTSVWHRYRFASLLGERTWPRVWVQRRGRRSRPWPCLGASQGVERR